MRQQTVRLGPQLLGLAALVVDEVPFVQADDQGASLALDQVGDRQVLLLERDRRIEQQHDDFGETTARNPSAVASFSSFSTTRARRRKPAVSNSLIRRPRQTVSSPMLSRVRPGPGPVSSRSSPRMRLSKVDLPAFGRPTTAICSGRCRIVLAAVLFFAEDERRNLVLRRRFGARALWQDGRERVVKIAESLAVLGGNRDRIAQAKAEGFVSAVAPRRPFGLVGDEDHRLA